MGMGRVHSFVPCIARLVLLLHIPSYVRKARNVLYVHNMHDDITTQIPTKIQILAHLSFCIYLFSIQFNSIQYECISRTFLTPNIS